jgi:NIPSNAP
MVPLDYKACCPIVELRQYTLHPGKRDTLIELFDREFVESQEQVGMRVIGQFRDMDNPDRFVWLRGFGDFNVRASELQVFYGGPVWAAHRAAANATMLDASNVLLLRPARAGGGFEFQGRERAPVGATELSGAMVVAAICDFDAPVKQGFIEFFERTVMPEMSTAGAPVAAYFVTESRANEFPLLPVREGENVFVWFTTFKSVEAYQNHLAQLNESWEWREKISVDLRRRVQSNMEILRLAPTARSLLNG